jgi:porphobilinogen synthase
MYLDRYLNRVHFSLIREEAELMSFPDMRPRRLRRSPALRRLVAETRPAPADLVLPMFIREGLTEARPVSSLPGVVQHSRDSLRKAAVEAVQAGVGGLMLFGVPAARDEIGSAGTDPDGVLNVAVADVISEVGDATVVMSDLCLDEFTSHGHCGVLAPDGSVDNDATLMRYADLAVAQARAGAHMLGLSGMMDGQVGVVRKALDAAGFDQTAVLAYAIKYASAFYGPFREAVESTLRGDRKTYQQDPANLREALREVALDVAEGADAVIVKPALPYLDVVSAVVASVDVPVAAYQVSGEYAMVEAAAANGWLDRERAIVETLTSIRRSGAQIILTYWAVEAAALLREGF